MLNYLTGTKTVSLQFPSSVLVKPVHVLVKGHSSSGQLTCILQVSGRNLLLNICSVLIVAYFTQLSSNYTILHTTRNLPQIFFLLPPNLSSELLNKQSDDPQFRTPMGNPCQFSLINKTTIFHPPTTHPNKSHTICQQGVQCSVHL